MTQKEAVLKYMEDYGEITPLEAFRDLGITKLATIVSLLRRVDGVAININNRTIKNRYGHNTTYAVYSLPKEKPNV